MRRRLRKKKRLGEFQELGVELEINLHSGLDFDSFLDRFLRDAVESNGLAFGGGGWGNRVAGFLELGYRDICGAKLDRVREWLVAENGIEKFTVGKLEDAWNVDG